MTDAADRLKNIRTIIDPSYQNGTGPADADENDALSQWQVFTPADAYKERPPLPYLISDVLFYPSLSIVYGGPGSLKSMILADMAVCVATGTPWLDAPQGGTVMRNYETMQAPVLWIDFDNGRRRTHERFDAFGKAYGMPADAPLYYVSMGRPQLDLTSYAMGDSLMKLIRRLGARLVIIDNLGLVIGDAEENSGDMAGVMGNLRSISEDAECATLMVHHQRKSNGAGDKGVRKGETLRGHSSIEASLDLALLVERKDGEDNVTVFPTKVRGYRNFDFFGAAFTYQHRDGTRDLEMARFFGQQVYTKDEGALRELQAAILTEVMAKPGIEQKTLVDSVRDSMAALNDRAPGVNRVRGIVSKMAKDGLLKEAAGDRAAKRYWLPT
jgi:hypothetical protein